MPPSHLSVTKGILTRFAHSVTISFACFLVPTNIIFLPRENGDFFLKTVNECYIGKLAKELISPSKVKAEKKEEKKEEDGQ